MLGALNMGRLDGAGEFHESGILVKWTYVFGFHRRDAIYLGDEESNFSFLLLYYLPPPTQKRWTAKAAGWGFYIFQNSTFLWDFF